MSEREWFADGHNEDASLRLLREAVRGRFKICHILTFTMCSND